MTQDFDHSPPDAATLLPQHGGCLCGDVRYSLDADPITLYVCHCTDCQSQSGASFALSMVVALEALQLVRGRPDEYSIELADGRRKGSKFCRRCATTLWGRSRAPELAILEPGTLDDTSWFSPVGHIWTRSAQPWVQIPDDTVSCPQQPDDEAMLAFVRAWKQREAISP